MLLSGEALQSQLGSQPNSADVLLTLKNGSAIGYESDKDGALGLPIAFRFWECGDTMF